MAQDLLVLGELVISLPLVPQDFPVTLDDEVALAAGDRLDFGRTSVLLDGGGQTGRARFVVSNYAVLDGDVHADQCSPVLGRIAAGSP